MVIAVDDACSLCCPHRKDHSQQSMNWLSVLAKSNIPVLVCLTHADKLVADIMPEPGVLPDPSESRTRVEERRQVCMCVCVCVCVCVRVCVCVCVHTWYKARTLWLGMHKVRGVMQNIVPQ